MDIITWSMFAVFRPKVYRICLLMLETQAGLRGTATINTFAFVGVIMFTHIDINNIFQSLIGDLFVNN